MNKCFTRPAWRRMAFMLVLAVFYGMAEMLLALAIVFQVVSVLASGSPNPHVRAFGAQLSGYIYQLFLYFTYNSDDCPFPFSAWPKAPVLLR